MTEKPAVIRERLNIGYDGNDSDSFDNIGFS